MGRKTGERVVNWLGGRWAIRLFSRRSGLQLTMNVYLLDENWSEFTKLIQQQAPRVKIIHAGHRGAVLSGSENDLVLLALFLRSGGRYDVWGGIAN